MHMGCVRRPHPFASQSTPWRLLLYWARWEFCRQTDLLPPNKPNDPEQEVVREFGIEGWSRRLGILDVFVFIVIRSLITSRSAV